MADVVKAVQAYSPRIIKGKKVKTDELVSFIGGRTGYNKSTIIGVLLEFQNIIVVSLKAGRAVNLEGLGIFSPGINKEGVIRINISMNMNIFSAHAKLTVATIIKTTPKENTICLTPKLGMRTKTVKKVPKILPAVEIEYRLPDMPPRVNILSADKRIE